MPLHADPDLLEKKAKNFNHLPDVNTHDYNVIGEAQVVNDNIVTHLTIWYTAKV